MFGMDNVARDMLPSLLWRMMESGQFNLMFDEGGFNVINCRLPPADFWTFATDTVGAYSEGHCFEEPLRELFCLVRDPEFDAKERDAAIKAYASGMHGRYTSFVASAVFDDWADNNAHWPEWPELKPKLDQGMERAEAIVRAVQQLLDMEDE